MGRITKSVDDEFEDIAKKFKTTKKTVKDIKLHINNVADHLFGIIIYETNLHVSCCFSSQLVIKRLCYCV